MPLNEEFLRDHYGRVRTPRGCVTAEQYDALRRKYPEIALPARDEIRLLSELTDEERRAWWAETRTED